MVTVATQQVLNQIGGREVAAAGGGWVAKMNPATGEPLSTLARSDARDVDEAVRAARAAQGAWAATPPVRRGEILLDVALALRVRRDEMARMVAVETGKGLKAASGETDGAVALGTFMAGEGQRLFGRTMTSGTPNKYSMTIRQPMGVAGLIIAANTPIANVAWKVFPALICGNAAVLKAAEDTPGTAMLFGRIAQEAGLPAGVLNIIHGLGAEAGEPLVAHRDVDVISFTGSTSVGRRIARMAGERLAKVSLELGGKNPLVVCDDADLSTAVRWVLLSAFSNAGQRCASGSRIIVFDAVYERFRELLVERCATLRVGAGDDDDFGPVINERQLRNILAAVERATAQGARVLSGGQRLEDEGHRGGYYLAPTLVECGDARDEISTTELFGPVASLYRVPDFASALALANDSPYGLTACIHTCNVHRAVEFTQKVQAGVAVVNAGTFGSEPHMPFGGVKQSGNGTREPGTEALDIYSSLKAVSFVTEPTAV
jgi:aldehyde dehydrogenase (NAD+)